jgi:hypothetical protein
VDALALARINFTYVWGHGRLPDLDRAPRFTEMVQRRKLYDRDPRQTELMDKVAAKALAGRVLGAGWMVPTAWQGTRLPRQAPFAFPAIIKARHGCNQYRALRRTPTAAQWGGLRALGDRWMRQPYGFWLDEWAYRDTQRGLLAEPLLDAGTGRLPVDYKIYVFGGRATHVQVHLERGAKHRWILHDRAWSQLVKAPDAPLPPRSLAAMLDAAEALAAGQEFLRVDFYEVGGAPLFGEFCLYPGSGLDPFAADWIDLELGALWHAAAADRLCAAQHSIDFPGQIAHMPSHRDALAA